MFNFSAFKTHLNRFNPKVLVGAVLLGIFIIVWLTQSSNMLPIPSQLSQSSEVRPPITKLVSLHRAYQPLSADSWNPDTPMKNQHPQFNLSSTVKADSSRNTVYILPVGQISSSWFAIIQKTAHLLSRLFCIEVVGLESISGADIPEDAKRRTGYAGIQLHSVYLTDQYLAQKVPDNAIALIAFSSYDLWPGGKTHYSISQSNYAKRTAVWSLFRIGRPNASETAYQHALRRTLKLAAHETGHFMGLGHSTKHFGLMNGSNSLREAEAQPLFLSPESLQYVMDHASCSLKQRFKQLRKFFLSHHMAGHARMMQSSLEALN